MDYPLPIRFIQLIIKRISRPVLLVGLTIWVFLLGLYIVTGSIYPTGLLVGFQDPLEATGMFLLFSALPAYLLGGLVAQVRATPGIVSTLSKILKEEHQPVLQQMDHIRYWQVGVLAGLLNALAFNIPWEVLVFNPGSTGFVFSLTLAFAQCITWSAVGLVLTAGLYNAFVLYRVGKLVNIDILNLDSLNSFGQSSLRGMLIIVGALAMMPLQAIDQEFRWVNYQNGILVGVPAIFLLMLVSNWSVHQRIREAKKLELDRLDKEIIMAPRTLDDVSLNRLNALLQRKQLVSHLRNWPMDFSLVTRILFYVLIPPLAWAGAALVELALDSYLTG